MVPSPLDFRSFVAQLANQKDTKKANTDGDSIINNSAESQVEISKDIPALSKALPNAKNLRVAGGRKGRTLTAILTARSEVRYSL